jgi:hypothetical protein
MPNRPDDPRARQPAQPKTRYAWPAPGAPIELTPKALRHTHILARRAVIVDRSLTWLEASLLIDSATQAPRGEPAAKWLRDNGASAKEAAQIIERAERTLRMPSGARRGDAVEVRLRVLEGAAEGRQLSGAEARERETLQRGQAGAVRARQRRLAWAQRAPDSNGSAIAAAAAAAKRATPRMSPPRMAR